MRKAFVALAIVIFVVSTLSACDSMIYEDNNVQGAVILPTENEISEVIEEEVIFYNTNDVEIENTMENEISLAQLIESGLQIVHGPISASIEIHDSIDYIVSDATKIVRAEIMDERVEGRDGKISLDALEREGTSETLFTVNRLRVLDVFSGDIEPGDIMEIRRILGRQTSNRLIMFPYRTELEVGEEVVLFIGSRQHEDGPSWLANPIQAAYRLPDLIYDDAVLESVHPSNNLTLTVQKLIEIAEQNGFNVDWWPGERREGIHLLPALTEEHTGNNVRLHNLEVSASIAAPVLIGGDTLTVEFAARNTSNRIKSVQFILALHDAADALVDVSMQESLIPAGALEEVYLHMPIPGNTDGLHLRVMVWDSYVSDAPHTVMTVRAE